MGRQATPASKTSNEPLDIYPQAVICLPDKSVLFHQCGCFEVAATGALYLSESQAPGVTAVFPPGGWLYVIFIHRQIEEK